MSKKILLVEDEALIALSEAQMLKKYGYEVVTAYNGEKAVEMADNDSDISLILMDIDLGDGIDGTEAAEKILNKKDIPVVFLSSHTEPEVVEKTEKITSYGYVVKNSGATVIDASIKMAFKLFEAKNEAKKHEEALRESEATVRKRLKAITEPEGDIDTLELADIIDYEALQTMMEDFYKLSGMGGAILDISGKILVGVAWQEICLKFHRVHPDTQKNCLESDLELTKKVPVGTSRAYHCKNNMWDIVTPIVVDGKHLGNIFIGQFFYEDEIPDYELFRRQARQYGFDEKEYLAALDRVPRFSREAVDRAMTFYSRLAGMISSLSYTAIKLSRNMVEHKQVEERLKASEEKFRAFVENANDIIYQLTPEGVFTYVSPNWTEILGYRQEKVIGDKVEKFVHPDDLYRCIDFLNKVLATGEKQSGVEYRVKHKNGTWRWHNSNGAPIKDENGNNISFIGIARDITERRKTEELWKKRNAALHEINQYSIELSFLRHDELYPYIIKKLKTIFKTSTAWVTEYDENTSHMVVKSTSLSDKDNSWVIKKLGKKVIGHRTQVNEEQYKMMRNIQAGNRQTLHEVSFGAIPEKIAALIEKGLNIDWFMPVVFINNNKITGAAVIAGKPGEEAPDRELLLAFADITGEVMRRKRAEEVLKEQKDLLQNITDNMFDLVALTDIHGTFKFAGKSHSILGYDAAALVGRNVFEYLHPEDITRVEASFSKWLKSNEPRRKEEYRYRCTDGSYIWLETVGKKLFGEDEEIKELLFSSRDITERKKSEEQTRELRERLQKIIDNSPLLINEIDVSGHYVMTNEAACRLLGTTKEELIGKHFKEALPPDAASMFKKRIDHVSGTGKPMTVDDTLRIDRQERIFRTVLFPIYRHGESLPSIIGMAYEITTEMRLLKEKDTLMQELNHRVKNNLFMISSFISIKDSESEIDLSDLKHQIEAIGLIHEKLYQTDSVTEICCRDYFDELLNSIFSSFTARRVKIDEDMDDFCVSTKTAVCLGIIINEIATNAIKYGFNRKEKAVFSIKSKEDRENNQYELTLSNTGNPFPEDIDVDNSQTLGLRLITALTEQLGGTIDLKRGPRPVFTIRFPIGEK